MDPIFNAQAISWLAIGILVAYLISAKRFSASELFWCCLLICSPILISGTVQKMFYFGDILMPLVALRYFFSFKKLPRLAFRKMDLIDLLSFYLLVISPITTNTLQIIFAELYSDEFMMLTGYRSATAFLIYYSVRGEALSRQVGLARFGTLAAVAALCVSIFGFSNYRFGISSDILSVLGTTSSITDWTTGYGGGLLGMYRGELGAYIALLLAICLPFGFSTISRGCISALTLYLSIYCVMSVGSRQGLLAILLVLITIIAFGAFSKSNRPAALGTLGILVVGILGFSTILAIDHDFYVWIAERFDLAFAGASEIASAIENRDGRTPAIVAELLRNIPGLLIGFGYGGFNEQVIAGDWRMTYVDSELLWVVQQNGLVGLACYGALLIAWANSIRMGALSRSAPLESLAASCSLFVSISLLYGHYVFLNWQTSHASVAYLHWVILALTADHGCGKQSTA